LLKRDGILREWVGTCTDCEEQKRAKEILEQTVAERTAKLRETIGDLESFSYSITHDLRAPLRALQGFSVVLKEEHDARLDDTARDYLDRIATSAHRMDKLILDVLAYSQVLRMDLKLDPVDVSKLLRSIIQSYPNLQEPKMQITLSPNCRACWATRPPSRSACPIFWPTRANLSRPAPNHVCILARKDLFCSLRVMFQRQPVESAVDGQT
jgi:signal transduction histidine kinase